MNILDSKFYSLLDKLSNFFILNTFWIISCIPIITVGPATAAMFGVVRQWKLNQDTSVVRNYFRYFKENFKQSFLIGILWIIISLLLYLNYFYLAQDHSSFKYVILVPLLLISLFFMATSAYLFSIITHYKVNWKSAIKNSFFIAVVNFPTTVIILIMLSLITAILIYLPATSLILFSIGAYLNFSLCNRAFKKFEQIRMVHNTSSAN
ncbi:MAG: DUF624 domain-containing protein [Bacillota bacterium]|nr:DUF624 domain-containing protein [Bacillota bacterium]